MIYRYPILLDGLAPFNEAPAQPLSFPICSGYDGNNIRVTNLVGYANGDFIKWCPHCKRNLPSELFGLRKTINQDQSWCMDCR